jgi:hypothetical protein
MRKVMRVLRNAVKGKPGRSADTWAEMDEEAAVENEAFFIRLKTTNDRQEVDIKVKPENTIAEVRTTFANVLLVSNAPAAQACRRK